MNENKTYPIPGRVHSIGSEGIVTGANEILDDDAGLKQSVINQLNKVVVTLNAAPTENTLTYTVDGVTCDFKVGDEARVSANGSYVYYKLFNIANNQASWKKLDNYKNIEYDINLANVSGAVSIDGSIPLHLLIVTSNVSSVSLSTNPSSGHFCHIIFIASSTMTVEIGHDSTNRICPNAEDISIEIPAGGYVEVDFLNINNNVYVRGI